MRPRTKIPQERYEIALNSFQNFSGLKKYSIRAKCRSFGKAIYTRFKTYPENRSKPTQVSNLDILGFCKHLPSCNLEVPSGKTSRINRRSHHYLFRGSFCRRRASCQEHPRHNTPPESRYFPNLLSKRQATQELHRRTMWRSF